ncbi:Hypothetical predicted protein [Marmota monax]|uniref:Uncharacterized protein n=1 Tax=Marmota monax TaxID=9995 RepID=A0A5E4AQG7_MARMO|nr:hypothetical protein GHT09_005000 [Marmota monax]VTJ59733.1 Hypothetical predicted protein [Marmota monax]
MSCSGFCIFEYLSQLPFPEMKSKNYLHPLPICHPPNSIIFFQNILFMNQMMRETREKNKCVTKEQAIKETARPQWLSAPPLQIEMGTCHLPISWSMQESLSCWVRSSSWFKRTGRIVKTSGETI